MVRYGAAQPRNETCRRLAEAAQRVSPFSTPFPRSLVSASHLSWSHGRGGGPGGTRRHQAGLAGTGTSLLAVPFRSLALSWRK